MCESAVILKPFPLFIRYTVRNSFERSIFMKRYSILHWIGWTLFGLLVLAVLVFVAMFVLFAGVPITRTTANPERYHAYQAVCDGAGKYMPALSDCGSPEKLRLTQLRQYRTERR